MKSITFLVVTLLLASPITRADMLVLAFDDPIGDSTGTVDVISLEMNFDNVSGGYSILLSADPAAPFLGELRINVNLFNVDLGTFAINPSLFSASAGLVVDVHPATTTFQLNGTSSFLTEWQAGDQVLSNNPDGSAGPLPDGVAGFQSTVSDVPVINAFSNRDRMGEGFSTISLIPIPASLPLFATAVAGLTLVRRSIVSR